MSVQNYFSKQTVTQQTNKQKSAKIQVFSLYLLSTQPSHMGYTEERNALFRGHLLIIWGAVVLSSAAFLAMFTSALWMRIVQKNSRTQDVRTAEQDVNSWLLPLLTNHWDSAAVPVWVLNVWAWPAELFW